MKDESELKLGKNHPRRKELERISYILDRMLDIAVAIGCIGVLIVAYNMS
jgi:hypothetical protein